MSHKVVNYLKKLLGKRISSKFGQHIIEYAVLLIVVMAGIMIMGPYVIRSWNASVKGLEDSVQDSLQEPMQTAPPGLPTPACVCKMGPPCPSPVCCGFAGCAETENSIIQICDPVDCGPPVPAVCTTDINCCTTPVPMTVPDDCGKLNCGPFEIPAIYYCGNDPTQRVQCQYNPNCEFQCQGAPGTTFHYNGICPFDNLGLNNNTTNYTTVPFGGCSSPAGSIPKCQVECADTFSPIPGPTGIDSCGCPGGIIYDQGTCPPGEFFQIVVGGGPWVMNPALPTFNPKCYPINCGVLGYTWNQNVIGCTPLPTCASCPIGCVLVCGGYGGAGCFCSCPTY